MKINNTECPQRVHCIHLKLRIHLKGCISVVVLYCHPACEGRRSGEPFTGGLGETLSEHGHPLCGKKAHHSIKPGVSSLLPISLRSSDLCGQEPLTGALPSTSSVDLSLCKLRVFSQAAFQNGVPQPTSICEAQFLVLLQRRLPRVKLA